MHRSHRRPSLALTLLTTTSLAGCLRSPFPDADTLEDETGPLDPSITMTGAESISSGPTATGPTTTGEEAETGTPGDCEGTNLGSEVPISVSGSTQTEVDNQFVPCVGEGSAPDALYQWRAPYASTFIFDTFGSSFDTALVLRSPDCEEVYECNDDSNGDLTSTVARFLEEGEQVIVQVDGFINESGNYQLNIRDAGGGGDGSCPIDVIEQVPTEWFGSTSMGSNQYASACGGAEGREIGLIFVPPFDGVYYFESFGETETILSIRSDSCGGPEIVCSPFSFIDPIELPAGVPLIVMIDTQANNPTEVGVFVDYLG